MHRQHKVKTFLAILVASMWFSTSIFAQDPDPDPAPLIGSQTIDDPAMTNNSDPIVSNNNGIDPPPDPGIPVDGGLTLLLAAGAAYGVRKLRRTSVPMVRTEKGD
jgi:hypothetical protein